MSIVKEACRFPFTFGPCDNLINRQTTSVDQVQGLAMVPEKECLLRRQQGKCSRNISAEANPAKYSPPTAFQSPYHHQVLE